MLNLLKKRKHKEHCAVRLGRFMNEDMLDIGTRDLSGGGPRANCGSAPQPIRFSLQQMYRREQELKGLKCQIPHQTCRATGHHKTDPRMLSIPATQRAASLPPTKRQPTRRPCHRKMMPKTDIKKVKTALKTGINVKTSRPCHAFWIRLTTKWKRRKTKRSAT